MDTRWCDRTGDYDGGDDNCDAFDDDDSDCETHNSVTITYPVKENVQLSPLPSHHSRHILCHLSKGR